PAGPATRPAAGRTSSCPAARGPSTRERARSSAASSASAPSACPGNPSCPSRPRAGDLVRELVTPDRLGEVFAPRSLALVGASDTSGWARFVVAASEAVGFTGPLIPVHPVHPTALGRPAVRSLRDLDDPPDLAFILVPTEAVPDVIDDAAAAGV